jgi:hypothetical protein
MLKWTSALFLIFSFQSFAIGLDITSRFLNRNSTTCAVLLQTAKEFASEPPQDQVLASVHLEGKEDIQKFFDKLAQNREVIRSSQPTLRRLLEADTPFLVLAALGGDAFAGVLDLAVATQPSAKLVVVAAGWTAAMAAVGGFDYPVRWFRNFNFAYRNLRRTYEASAKNKGFYWSQDFEVTQEFLENALKENGDVNTNAIDLQNSYETRAGVYRWLIHRILPRTQATVTVTIQSHERADGVPELDMALRLH